MQITPQQLQIALPTGASLIPLGLVIWLINKIWKLEKEMHKRTSKGYADETFQRKDLCSQTVNEVKSDLKEIKSDVKTLLTMRRNGK